MRRYISPLNVGRRAMVLNISDIGAMGGRPLYALVSLGLKGETLVRDIEEMYRGFLAELNPFGALIIGGNLTESGNGMFIDITLIGEVEQGKGVRRSGARPGDAILVTGYPGRSAAGLQLLLRAPDDGKLLENPLVKIYNTPFSPGADRRGDRPNRAGHGHDRYRAMGSWGIWGTSVRRAGSVPSF